MSVTHTPTALENNVSGFIIHSLVIERNNAKDGINVLNCKVIAMSITLVSF